MEEAALRTVPRLRGHPERLGRRAAAQPNEQLAVEGLVVPGYQPRLEARDSRLALPDARLLDRRDDGPMAKLEGRREARRREV